jgi:hypothetical protein
VTWRGGSKQLSRKRATAALSQLLCSCTAERLAEFTAAGLAATHNVTVDKADEMLSRARQGRLV